MKNRPTTGGVPPRSPGAWPEPALANADVDRCPAVVHEMENYRYPRQGERMERCTLDAPHEGRRHVYPSDVMFAAPAPSSPRAEAPEAEPADAAALAGLVLDVEAHLLRLEEQSREEYGRSSTHPRDLVNGLASARGRLQNIADELAALRRAAPGAAPEREVSRANALDALADLADMAVTGGVGGRLYATVRAYIGTLEARATPAPTGERAGGEAVTLWAIHESGHPERVVVWETHRSAAYSIHRNQWGKGYEVARCVARPAPVAAPRGTEGRHDA